MTTLDIIPIGKPRMVRSDAWKGRECVKRYWEYKHSLQVLALQKRYVPGNELNLTFILPMPGSWSKAKRELTHGTPHLSSPDLDNLIKAFQDCLMKQDNSVWKLTAKKVWGNEGSIIIEN